MCVRIPIIETLNRQKPGIARAAEVISLCVRHVSGKSPAYPEKAYNFRDEDDMNRGCIGYCELKFYGDQALIAQLVQLCIATANTDQCAVIFDRMRSGKKRDTEAWRFYEAFVPDMAKVIEAHPELRPPFKGFFEDAVSEFLDQGKEASESLTLALFYPRVSDAISNARAVRNFDYREHAESQISSTMSVCPGAPNFNQHGSAEDYPYDCRTECGARRQGLPYAEGGHTPTIPSPVHLSSTFWISPMTLALMILSASIS
ncbi:uncharacterized protein BT62DRAFT_664604 [Guyanagaster necrorhizus]|uniref:Uncharacterized protein n=1 Tax=Guyanagaster necrorhizus TaxID=856835 RepID=A0A9P7VYA0_9AGAR|nr:uncharacterized protein BT62DRAFT_664604 [Guyanagaster necrorhizus MCA 3950]KAG7449132.1 hypothetical protein BT62DRAFT_664604 [Guyanagaster necrorhizus MCA 3950]